MQQQMQDQRVAKMQNRSCQSRYFDSPVDGRKKSSGVGKYAIATLLDIVNSKNQINE